MGNGFDWSLSSEQVMSNQFSDGVQSYTLKSSSRLRLRFATWSLVVVGSLSSSVFVSLPSAAWGFDEPPAKEKGNASEEPATKQVDEPFSRSVFSRLLSQGKTEEAAKLLEAALARTPDASDLMSMELQLVMLQSRTAPYAQQEKLAALAKRILSKDKLDALSAMNLAQVTLYRVPISDKRTLDDKLQIIDEALNKLTEGIDAVRPDLVDIMATPRRILLQTKCRVLLAADKADEAKKLLDDMLANARSLVASGQKSAVSTLTSVATLYHSSLNAHYPSEAAAAIAEAEDVLRAGMTKADAGVADYSAYISLKLTVVSSLLYEDPKQCEAVLADLEKAMEEAKSRFEEKDLRALATITRSVDSIKSRLKSALLREELIGKDAPEIDAEHFVAMPPVTMSDLRGKVVLIDFWAVWCGPCIATFPHLIEWHEKYADRGLVILGATKFYSYKWDEAANKASRAEDVSPEDELAMLEKFRESYKLHHGFLVSPKASEYSSAFAVSGIPQAVLLDQQGKIQLIRVGSGEANAKAIEAKIQELLGIDSQASPAGQ